MILSDIALKARADVNADSNSYTDANLLININIWVQKIVTMIMESMDGIDFDDQNISTTYPIATRPLVSTRRDYAFGTASWTVLGKEGGANSTSQTLLPLKIKRLDITYDGTNYVKAEPIDDGEIALGLGNDTLTDNSFYKSAPRYDVKFNSVFIYPQASASDVTAGALMRIEQERAVIPFTSGDLTTGTATPGFDSPFHPFVAKGASYEYAFSHQLAQAGALQGELQDWEARLKRHYGRKDLDRRMTLGVEYDDSYGR